MNIIGFEEEGTEKDNRLHVIDPNTKELKNYINKGDKIVRQSSIESFKALKAKQSDGVCMDWNMRNFYKSNTEELKLILKELTQNERSLLLSMTPYIIFENNSLQIGKGEELHDIGTEELVDISGMSRSVVYETIKSLIDKDVIYKGKNSKNAQYYINPWLFCKGNRINTVLKNMFKNYKIRSQGNILWKDLND